MVTKIQDIGILQSYAFEWPTIPVARLS